MKKRKLALLLLVLASMGSTAQTIPQVDPGTDYRIVRRILVKYNWTPVKQTEDCGSVCQARRREGYVETRMCQDTGAYPCLLIFKNADGKILKVNTVGEPKLSFTGFS